MTGKVMNCLASDEQARRKDPPKTDLKADDRCGRDRPSRPRISLPLIRIMLAAGSTRSLVNPLVFFPDQDEGAELRQKNVGVITR
jgi:hypothetical protein